MILVFVLVTISCSAFAFPHYSSQGDSDIERIIWKKNQENVLVLPDRSNDKNQEESNSNGIGARPFCAAEFGPDDNTEGRLNNDDTLLHLSSDNDLYKFLEWTMAQLGGGSLNSYNASGSYYTGMNMWKKGRREQPLYVEEPKYIVVRREQDDLEPKLKFGHDDFITFIPPRGRKYIPELENLLARRNDLFVPNRGKKDKIKDIFKYDDLFFPNRGKKRTPNVSSDGQVKNNNKVRYYYQSAANDHQPFVDCFTPNCDDITSASAPPPSPSLLVTNQVENINALVSSASTFNQPQLPWQVSSLALDDTSNIATDGHQDAVACTVAECQKENDVKINGFDQSVKAQIRQRQQHSEGGAFNQQQRNRRRLLSSSSASLATGTSTFLPFIPSDRLNRLQLNPIRNKQWRDYYIQKMAALSRQAHHHPF